jgi:endonuclease-3
MPSPHNAWRGRVRQGARRGSQPLGAPTPRPYKTGMTQGKSRRARAARAEAIFERLAAANPEPKGELESVNPFTLLVAVVLSAQATDAGVNKATRGLFAIADTPQKMAALGVERLTDLIKTIGLYRAKARNVIALSQAILDRHGGETPRTREALEALPGVGRKTANVVLNTAFGEPTLAVDTHVFRVANRLAIAPGRTPREVEDELMRVVPERFLRHAHHWLILHGRYVCKARKPLCGACVLVDLCPFEPKTSTASPAA